MKHQKRKSNNNIVYIVILAIVSLLFLAYFLQNNFKSASATIPKVNVRFSPSSGSYNAGPVQTVALRVQTQYYTRKISGYMLTVQSSKGIALTNISAPRTLSGGSLSATQTVKKKLSNQMYQIGYVITAPESSLPTGVIMDVSFLGTSPGTNSISVNTANSQVVGNITGNVYDWGEIYQGTYTISGGYPTPSTRVPTSVPTASPTRVPTTVSQINCATQCDGNGDKCITPATQGADWDDFLSCYNYPTSHSYCYSRWEVNRDKTINLVDFSECQKYCACK